MTSRDPEHLTPEARFFLEPTNAAHRQYESLRAYFLEQRPSNEVAEEFGYTAGSFRVLCHQFRHNPDPQFFLPTRRGPREPKTDRLRQRVVGMRKQNFSVYEISDSLKRSGDILSPPQVSRILRAEGFAPLPRRRDEERPEATRVIAADSADARLLDLTPRKLVSPFAGLFLFVPDLIRLDELLRKVDFPGTEMVPAGHAMRSLLALKLYGDARRSHFMSEVFDDGLALFAGLNVIPKRSFLTEYTCRVHPGAYPKLMSSWFAAVSEMGLPRGDSFDLDFHTIPFHGEDALLQKHYVSKRSRRQKGILAFLASDADNRVFCYANASLRKQDQADEILRFAEFWKQHTERLPKELVFDSKVTTYENLNRLNAMNIRFITLRRRSQKMLEEARQRPLSAWRRVELSNVARAYRTPRVLDERIRLKGYEGKIRQLVVADLGHEEPTFSLTNQLRRSAPKLVQRYAHRMLIENAIADGIDFFHMDALSSAVAMKVHADIQLTLIANSLYRLFGRKVANGYAEAKSRRIFRDFIRAIGTIELTETEIVVSFQKRARNPLLIAAGFAQSQTPVPWLAGRRLRFRFG